MIPVWLLIIGPFCVIEVTLRLWLVVTALRRLVFVDISGAVGSAGHVIVDVLFDVISLSSDRITERLICLLNFLEHLTGLVPFRISEAISSHKVRMILLCHSSIGLFYLRLCSL